MRLLFITHMYPPYARGGLENRCFEVANALNGRGHEVRVITSKFGANSTQSNHEGVSRTLHFESDLYFYNPVDFFLRRRKHERANREDFCNLIDGFQPDLVMIWGLWNLSRNLPLIAEQSRPGRVVYFVADYWPIEDSTHERYWKEPARHRLTELVKKPLRSMALSQLQREGYPPSLEFQNVICCSKYVRKKLSDADSVFTGAEVIYPGVDSRQFEAIRPRDRGGRNELRLLYFGTLSPNKGVATAIEALGILKAMGLENRLSLTVLGNGHPDYASQLDSLVSDLGLESIVRFEDWIPSADVPRWLAAADVFLFTSIWPEPMGRTVMEAMASGMLVIGTKVGGQKEMLVDGKNCLTFRPGNAPDLASQIQFAFDNPEVASDLAANGLSLVAEHFRWDGMVDKIEDYLAGVVSSEWADHLD